MNNLERRDRDDSQIRLNRVLQIDGLRSDLLAKIEEHGDRSANRLLNQLQRPLTDKRFFKKNTATDIEYYNTRYLMPAVHILNFAGYDIDFDANINGTRRIKTEERGRLNAVMDVFENVEKDMQSTLTNMGVDDKKVPLVTAKVMDEVVFTVFSELREKRDKLPVRIFDKQEGVVFDASKAA